MNDEQLLEAVAQLARASGKDALSDPLWQKLAAGGATAEERASLQAMVASGQVPSGSIEAHEPLSEASRDRFAAAALASLGPQRIAPVIDLASRRRRGFTIAAGLLAAAAMLFLVLKPPPQDSGGGSLPGEGSLLPGYELTLTGGDRIHRSDSEPAILRSGAPFEVLLRPATAVSPPPAVAVVWIGGDTRTAWSGPVAISPQGAVRLSGTVGVELPAGPVEVTLEIRLTPADGEPLVVRRLISIEAAK
ncbi:MAG: hypothetical protein ACI9WU_000401 [Myxococcota bacterium]|jgi:hypothetical protein